MNNKARFYILLVAGFLATETHAQEIISTQGDFYSTTAGELSWTIGEPVIVTGNGGGHDLTQGFHQDYTTIMSIQDLSPALIFTVYPNPAEHTLHLRLQDANGTFEALLVDALGKQVEHVKLNAQGTASMDISSCATGVYFLQLLSDQTLVKSYKISKIN